MDDGTLASAAIFHALCSMYRMFAVSDAFRNQTDAQRTFREIMFLQHFGDHPNIIRLLDVHRADNDKDIYLIFEYMGMNIQ